MRVPPDLQLNPARVAGRDQGLHHPVLPGSGQDHPVGPQCHEVGHQTRGQGRIRLGLQRAITHRQTQLAEPVAEVPHGG